MFLIDLFFPKRNLNYSSVGSYLTTSEIAQLHWFEKHLETLPNSLLRKVWVASDLDNLLIRDLLYRFKYGGEWAIAEDFADLLGQTLLKINFPNSFDLLISVPADPKRLAQRGYHPPKLLAEKLSKIVGIKFVNSLIKTKHTRPQTKLERQARLENLTALFAVKTESIRLIQKAKNILLIDDVVTTGSTFNECAKQILYFNPSAQIYGIAVAGHKNAQTASQDT